MNISGIGTFAKSLTGEVVLPHDRRYGKLRRVRNHAVNMRPAIIVRCANSKDVQLAVEFARDKDLITAVRSGGHSFAGHGVCDDGLVVDLSLMKRALIDPVHEKVRIRTGNSRRRAGLSNAVIQDGGTARLMPYRWGSRLFTWWRREFSHTQVRLWMR